MKQMKKYLKTEQTVKPEDEPVHTDSQRGNALLRSKEKKAEEVRDKSDRKQKLEHQTSQG